MVGPQHLLHSGDAAEHFEPTGLAQSAHALALGLGRQGVKVLGLHQQSCQVVLTGMT